MATSYSPDNRVAAQPDPGAVDNRLSLDPNNPTWKSVLDGWKDGGRYHMTISDDEGNSFEADLDQISPGEFEAIPTEAEVETPNEEIAAGEEEEAMPAKGGKAMAGVSGPVRRMMEEEA